MLIFQQVSDAQLEFAEFSLRTRILKQTFEFDGAQLMLIDEKCERCSSFTKWATLNSPLWKMSATLHFPSRSDKYHFFTTSILCRDLKCQIKEFVNLLLPVFGSSIFTALVFEVFWQFNDKCGRSLGKIAHQPFFRIFSMIWLGLQNYSAGAILKISKLFLLPF